MVSPVFLVSDQLRLGEEMIIGSFQPTEHPVTCVMLKYYPGQSSLSGEI